jgi:phosphatidate cytidylyltransferase
MSNLAVRIVSALVMAAVSLTAMVADTRSRWAVFALFLSLAGWEWARMLRAKFGGPKVEILSGVVVLLAALAHLPGSAVAGPGWAWGLCCASVLVFTVLGFRSLDITVMAPWIYLNLFGLAYFGLYAASIFGLTWPYAGWKGIYPFLMVLILIAAADTGAYFTGRKFGRVKLAPTISSGKTREGALGGAAATTLLSLLLAPIFLETRWYVNLGLGLLMALTAILGDLFISVLKRYAAVKDSSHLIPGHGGVLDRFDALFFSAPVAVFYLNLVG